MYFKLCFSKRQWTLICCTVTTTATHLPPMVVSGTASVSRERRWRYLTSVCLPIFCVLRKLIVCLCLALAYVF